ncbi:MAG: pyridoxamine 5'-phosphate oxidase [Bacteroidales bacterium]
MKDFAAIRREYVKGKLERKDLDLNPMIQFKRWMDEAIAAGEPEPTAMNLATVDSHKIPHVRTVLLKDITDEGLVFFTNYQSNKGRQMDQNQFVAVNFFWPVLERQVRIVGKVKKTSAEVSDMYFNIRPENSRIGAWASPQSRVVDDKWVEMQYEMYSVMEQEKELVRPAHWGGYIIQPFEFEFWQGRPNRLHDRFVYFRDADRNWSIDRLAP